MTAYESTQVEGTDLEPRDVRALTEKMTVLEDIGRARDAEDLYLVVSQSGKEYLVDAREDACECPDAQYNLPTDDGREECTHQTRVAFATDERAIPAWVDTNAIDPNLADCVARTPRVAADGGQVLHENENDERGEGRPDNCECHSDDTLPCFTCWMAGFDAPNPDSVNE